MRWSTSSRRPGRVTSGSTERRTPSALPRQRHDQLNAPPGQSAAPGAPAARRRRDGHRPAARGRDRRSARLLQRPAPLLVLSTVGSVAALAKRGVQFMVCGTASRGLAGRIAGPGGDVEAILAEMGANLIPSARIVPAGVVAVVHAQERRFALVSVG